MIPNVSITGWIGNRNVPGLGRLACFIGRYVLLLTLLVCCCAEISGQYDTGMNPVFPNPTEYRAHPAHVVGITPSFFTALHHD